MCIHICKHQERWTQTCIKRPSQKILSKGQKKSPRIPLLYPFKNCIENYNNLGEGARGDKLPSSLNEIIIPKPVAEAWVGNECRQSFWLQRINLNPLQILKPVLMQGCRVWELHATNLRLTQTRFSFPLCVGIHTEIHCPRLLPCISVTYFPLSSKTASYI